LTMAPRMLVGADQYLPYWDERPFLPSLESVVSAATELLK
jgi:hypothetical protein